MAKILLLRTFKGISLFKDRKNTQTPFAPPLSLLYLASSLIEQGHNVDFIELTAESKPENKIQRHLTNSDIVIINLLPGNQRESESLTQFIRKNHPDITIIIQGLYCTIDAIKALNDIPLANICIRGEGENIINDVVRAIQGEAKLDDIAGIIYRKDKIIKNGKTLVAIKDLDTVLFPARQLVKNYDYGKLKNIYLCKPKFTSIITSRGCPFDCTYCSRKIGGKKIRFRSPENIISEIQYLSENFGLNKFVFLDDCATLSSKRIKKFCQMVIDLKLSIKWICITRVDTVSKDLLKEMKMAGCTSVDYGVESGNPKSLKKIRKGFSLKDVENTLRFTHEVGIQSMVNFMHGFHKCIILSIPYSSLFICFSINFHTQCCYWT